MTLCEQMNAQPDSDQYSLFDRLLISIENGFGKLQQAIATYRAHAERRDAFKNLQTLDRRTLDDIGLTAGDVTWASKLPIDQNAACELQKVRYARLSSKN